MAAIGNAAGFLRAHWDEARSPVASGMNFQDGWDHTWYLRTRFGGNVAVSHVMAAPTRTHRKPKSLSWIVLVVAKKQTVPPIGLIRAWGEHVGKYKLPDEFLKFPVTSALGRMRSAACT